MAAPVVESESVIADAGSVDPPDVLDLEGEDTIEIPHCVAHLPAQKGCEACRLAKMRNRRCYKGAFRREASEYGDLITIDHVEMTEGYGPRAIGGKKHFLNILDVATGYLSPCPTAQQDTQHT